ncbi:hypothetical protein BD310DRAFT_589327 [Dichomitus squalens]|uniref:Uncharacterized protein n=1 Tax=Dichomitus squalens TaxID=114155 RepID=A0A4Q9PRI4_9APHY|nr:hypothetical protein BD310DRAFT_589327 [Dichomitus squalens]
MSSSGSPTTALPHISIDTSIGAMLIGTFITLILYGVIVHQVYRYSRIYSSDKAGIKFAVRRGANNHPHMRFDNICTIDRCMPHSSLKPFTRH